MRQILRVIGDSAYAVRVMYVTPCCGAKHYKFEGEARQCFMCGRLLDTEPVVLEQEKDLSHLRFNAVSRYVS